MTEVRVWEDAGGWDSYVESKKEARNHQRWVWKRVVEDSFGHETHYLAAVSGNAVRGILPLVSIRSRLFGKSLVSVPFFSYGGVLADTDEIRDALLGRAVELARQRQVRHIELRQACAGQAGWPETSTKVTLEMALPDTPEELWKRFSTGLRNKIRKGQKSGLRVEWGGIEAVDGFYRTFAANMRNLGTPVYPKKWFESICRHSPGQTRIVNLWDGGQPVAGAFLTCWRDTLELPWSASLADSRKKYSHVLLYWTFLEWAIRTGFRRMDLGRCTPGGGTHEFKRHWICEEKPLRWSYWLAPGVPLPRHSPDNGRYRLAVRVWKHLPLAVANRLGPRIVRALP